MNVYITYDRYEHDEWYWVYHIETNKKRAIKHFKEDDLIDFLSYGPDDCHSFQLVKVSMPKKDYIRFCEMVENEKIQNTNSDKELKSMLMSIYGETNYEVETIFFTDGCSDCVDLIDFYIDNYDIETEEYESEDDIRDRIMKNLFDDNELMKKVLSDYIEATY